MPNDCISYQKSGYFSSLIVDYLEQKSNLKSLYNRYPNLEDFENQILEKAKNYDVNGKRKVLVSVLESQYNTINKSESTSKNIQLIHQSNTFTVTTGHQLNVFTGPLYFLYKIISTLNLTSALKSKYPDYNFVPIYWMATEDHDFEEINFFNFKGRKFRWNTESSGAVGRLNTESLVNFFEVFSQELDSGKNAELLKKLFREAYLNHSNLADATRYLVNELFGAYGLVILDADNAELKREFIPYVKEELVSQTAYKEVSKTIHKLQNYPIQVNPREINLFYLDTNLRERIVFENGKYKVNTTSIEFTQTEIIALLEKHPEKFSPNVILRPLYQEVILPNLAYFGGGGEIAYWLELKSFFEAVKVPFPILILRNSAVLVNEKQNRKADKLGLTWSNLFLKQSDLINLKTKELSDIPIDFSGLKEQLEKQFELLFETTTQTHKSFLGAVKAQEAKQMKGLDNLEKRLLKAQKKKYVDTLERITNLQNELFPNQSLQERYTNFSEMYLQTANSLIPQLISELEPLDNNFNIIELR